MLLLLLPLILDHPRPRRSQPPPPAPCAALLFLSPTHHHHDLIVSRRRLIPFELCTINKSIDIVLRLCYDSPCSLALSRSPPRFHPSYWPFSLLLPHSSPLLFCSTPLFSITFAKTPQGGTPPCTPFFNLYFKIVLGPTPGVSFWNGTPLPSFIHSSPAPCRISWP